MSAPNETDYKRRKRLGLCVRCGQPPAHGRTMCQKHIDDIATRRAARIGSGLCTYCAKSVSGLKTICTGCTQERAQQRQERKDTGLCVFPGCLNDSRLGKVYCQQCADKLSDKVRALKQTVLDHYEQRCHCVCGCVVTKFEHLTIDHKNGDGAEQRKDGRYNGGGANYRRIINAGFPDDLQVLCWNCNCAKYYYGGCV